MIAPWNAPSALELTESGKNAKEFFLLLYTNHGWWSNLWGGNGLGSWWAFMALVLSFESFPLWRYPSASGWGSGAGPDGWGDPKPLFTQAAAQWFWNWGGPDTQDAATKQWLTILRNAPLLSGTVITQVFDRIGSLGSFKLMRAPVVYPTDSNYINKSIPERLSLALPRYKWNAQEMFTVVNAIASPWPEWKTGGVGNWSNYQTDSPNLVYVYDNYRIYIP